MDEASKKNIFLLLWPYIWTKQPILQRFKFIVFIFFTIVTTMMVVSVPILLKQVIIVLEKQEYTTFFYSALAPTTIAILYGLAWLFTKVIDRIRHQAAFPMIANIILKLCLELFAHLQNLSMSFHNDKASGKIFNVVSRTRFAIAGFTQAIAQELIPLFLQILAASILLTYYYGLTYGLVLIVMVSVYFYLSVSTAHILITRRKEQNKFDGEANAFIVDSLLNAETIKYCSTEKYVSKCARELLNKKQNADVLSLMSDAKIHLMQNSIIGIAVLVITFSSGYSVIKQQLQLSDFVMINGFILMFMAPLSSLGYRYREAKLRLGHLESAFELLNEPIEIQDEAEATQLKLSSGLIEFDKVSFGYKADRMILHNISFSVLPGTRTAIVGASGSGKSTIAKLIFRLYEVNSGSIKIDNQDIKQLTRASICEAIGIVPQDTVMFNDSIKNNILYALPQSCSSVQACYQEQLSAASYKLEPNYNLAPNIEDLLNKVSLQKLIKNLPQGIDTIVGERGVKLSGGERQRLAIARLLARSPKIIIFDEATSALDLKTEKEIQNCLMQASQGITTIIIAHRLSTIKHADNIIVLDNGIIVEQGTHQQLLSINGAYAKLLAVED